MGLPFFLVDAFANRPFSGNPAVVCLLSDWPDDPWLQDVAAETKQSETAFLLGEANRFQLRWFTPKVEVALCGHATLAAAHVLWQQGLARSSDPIEFATQSGLLKALRLDGVSRQGEIELDFPLKPQMPADPPAELLPALGVSAKYVGRNQFDYLIEVESEAVLRQMAPDMNRLAAVPVRGTIVTSRSSRPEFDFVSRFFAPAAGIDEDPVTGSAHCCLGDFCGTRLGKSDLLAYQASPRGGVIHVRVVGDRAFLGGKAITVAQGEIRTEQPGR